MLKQRCNLTQCKEDKDKEKEKRVKHDTKNSRAVDQTEDEHLQGPLGHQGQ